MKKFTFTAQNSKHLNVQLEKFNALVTAKEPRAELFLTWGKYGNTGGWYVHGEWGNGLKTGLTFPEIVRYVQSCADLTVELLSDSEMWR